MAGRKIAWTPDRPRRSPRRLGMLAPAGVLFLASCARSPSILETGGPAAERIAVLWWVMLAVSALVVVAVAVLIFVGIRARRRSRALAGEPRWAWWLIVGGGVAFPALVLTALWGLTLREMVALSSPPSSPAVTVEVTGYRWWWEVRYPNQRAVTANEIHIPAGEPVEIVLESADIIHSFWVPELAGKTDMVPGRTNHMWIQADEPGTYRGQCAEFCGLQHANMAFLVIAEPRDRFDAWLAEQARPARSPTDPMAAAGEDVFLSQACVACHTIRGTEAAGDLGPDLTHVGGRRTLAAATIENTRELLRAWIADPQAFKEGALMPPFDLPAEELDALAAYLESLE